MNRTLRHIAGAIAVLTLVSLGFAVSAANPTRALAACTIPSPPANDELTANPDSSISIALAGSAGATSYNIYRGTASGGESSTPVANTTGTVYTDKNLSSSATYFYQFTAVNACGESARSAEDSSKTPPPASTGGSVAGVASGNSEIYYGENAMFGGLDWFQTLTGWFPQNLGSSGSNSPNQQVVDMAYATDGSMTFNNVVVPTSGLYTIEWRYAFQGGLFPSVNNRQMGVAVNGTVLTTTERFPITGSFDVYQDSSLQAHLNAGRNSVTLFAVSDHGVSRVDQLIVTPATASVPSGPTHLTVTPGSTGATLNWTASTSGSPTSYNIYRGTATDGEAVTPVATVSGTTTAFADTGLTNGKTYFYNVAASNSVGVSPDSNEVSISPGVTTTTPPAPTGLAANPADSSIGLTWNPSAGATSYNIYRGTAPGGEGATPVGMSTSDSFTDTGVTNGTGYYYTVAAVNAGGTSAKSAETNTVPTSAVVSPPVPFGVVITTAPGQINLQWTYEEGATSYQVYRSTTPGGEGATPLATTTSSSYTDSSVTSGVTYYYEITALTGATSSARSSEYSANTSGTGTAPPTPTGLTASPGNASVGLSWTASSGATSYNIYRGTTSGGEGATPVGTSTSTSFTDTGLTNGTTYYYKVAATNSASTSAQSSEVSATPTTTAPPPSSVQISAGGPATGTWAADKDFTGGSASSTTNAISTTGVTSPAPQSVYQHNRYGNFTYTIPGFTAGASYTIRLHFAEEYWTTAGSRIFNVLIDGTQVLTNFDIFATAGGEYKAVVEQFTEVAPATGTFTIQFSTVKDNAQINGIEILSSSTLSPPSTPTGLTATAGNGSVALSWTASSGAASYNIYRGTTPGGEGTTPVANSTTTSFTDTGLTNGTMYYYKVAAVSEAGTSAQSSEVSALPTTSSPPPSSLQISAGGPATGTWLADEDFSGGATAAVTNAISTTGVTNPAPQSVYQHNRYGNFTYTIPGFTAGATYTIRLHFAEEYWTTAGSRIFNVLIDGTQVLTNFDIFATAGGEYKAVVEQFTEVAPATGTFTIQFVTDKDNAQINGIEILSG